MKTVRKMYHKGSVWSGHGKKKNRLAWCCQLNREAAERRRQKKKRASKMYDSVFECLRANGIN